MGVMTPGGKLQPLVYGYVPTESSEAYDSVWKSFEMSPISFASKFRRCSLESCQKCDCIHEVLNHENARKMLPTFKTEKRLATDFASSDNLAYKKFSKEAIGLPAMQCISHLTGMYFLFCQVVYLSRLSCLCSNR